MFIQSYLLQLLTDVMNWKGELKQDNTYKDFICAEVTNPKTYGMFTLS
jgi:hypothetical protein